MIRTPVRSPLFGLLAIAVTATPVVARAQITEVGRTPVADVSELTFGYRCDDRFVIRNDGNRPVELAYAVEKGTEHIPVTLGARELLELESKSKDALELWMGGEADRQGREGKAELQGRRRHGLRARRATGDRGERTAAPFERVVLGPSVH